MCTSEGNDLKVLFTKIKCSLDFNNSDSDDCDADDGAKTYSGDDNTEKNIDNYVFIDMQGFKGHFNRFICKEFCLIDGTDIFHEMIRSPFPLNRLSIHLRKQADWVTQNYHGLNYEDGDTHIIELTERMFPKLQNKKILVKGGEKVKWLKCMFRNCGEINCTNIENFNIKYTYREMDAFDSCEFHRWISEGTLAVCAKYNALILQDLAKRNVNVLH